MSDVLEELKEIATREAPPPLVNIMSTCSCGCQYRDAILRAIAEIERLRAVAGAVSVGESFADFKKRTSGVC